VVISLAGLCERFCTVRLSLKLCQLPSEF